MSDTSDEHKVPANYRSKLAELYDSYHQANAEAFRAALETHHRSLQALPAPDLERQFRALVDASDDRDVRFVEAIGLSYLLVLFKGHPESLDAATRATLADAYGRLAPEGVLGTFTPEHCAEVRARFWEQFAQDPARVSEQHWLELYGCEGASHHVPTVRLYDGLVLGPVNAGSSFSFVLDRPQDVAEGFTAEIQPQPPQPILFDHDGHQMALQTRPLTELPADSHTHVFTIVINGNRPYRVVLAINLGMTIPVLPGAFVPTQSVHLTLSASGGPDDCNSLPPGANLPCGPMRWTWVGDGNAALPSGLHLTTLPDGNARLAGTVYPGAHSAEGVFRLEQGEHTVERRRTFGVPVHFAEGAAEAIAGPHDLERAVSFQLSLPRPFGGNGREYRWSVDPTDRLPSGLHLGERQGNAQIEGVVGADAPLGRHQVNLVVHSPLAPSAARLALGFNVARPFRVFTQNTYLRPPDLIRDSFYLEAASLLLTPWTAPTYWPLIAFAASVEAYYDSQVENTDDDNAERLELLLRWISNRYDIIAFQELFADPAYERVQAWATPNGLSFLPGPADKGFSAPGGLSTDALQEALAKSRSGLGLLVRRDLSDPARRLGGTGGSLVAEATRWVRFAHHAEQFTACHGFLEAGSDCLAQKGFTFTTVHFDADPNDFLHVVNTHLDSDGDPNDKDPHDVAARSQQLSQIADFVDIHASRTHPVLFLGDFNIRAETAPGGTLQPTGEYRVMKSLLKADDLYRLHYPLTQGRGRDGNTIDNQVNAYGFFWEDGAEKVVQQRIDFMLVRQGTAYQLEVPHITVVGDDSYPHIPEQSLTTVCRNKGVAAWNTGGYSLRCWISDHFGLEAGLRLVRV